jgi:hypothetical protein
MARAGGELWREADVGPFAAMALHFLGRDAEAAAELDIVEAVAERLGHRQSTSLAFRVRNMMAVRDKAYVQQMPAWLQADRENWKEFLSVGSWEADYHALAAVGEFVSGRWDEAAAAADRATQISIFWVWNLVYTGITAMVAAYRGDKDTALQAAAAVERELPPVGQSAPIGVWSACIIMPEVLVMMGEREHAAEFRPLLDRVIETGAVSLSYTTRLVRVGAALAAWADGDRAAAEQHLAIGESRAKAIGDDIQDADIKRFRAMMLLDWARSGDVEAARRLLGEAAAAYAELGMPRHQALAETMLAQAGAAAHRGTT